MQKGCVGSTCWHLILSKRAQIRLPLLPRAPADAIFLRTVRVVRHVAVLNVFLGFAGVGNAAELILLFVATIIVIVAHMITPYVILRGIYASRFVSLIFHFSF